MAVKDLVGLFEAQSPPESSRSSRRVSFRRRSHSPTSAPQTPARFLRHPLLSEEPRSGRTADGLPRRNMTSGPVRELDAAEDLEMHDPPGDDTVVSQRHTDSPEVLSFTRTSSRRLGDMSTDVTDERLYLESNAPESSRRNSTTVIGSSGAEYEMHSFCGDKCEHRSAGDGCREEGCRPQCHKKRVPAWAKTSGTAYRTYHADEDDTHITRSGKYRQRNRLWVLPMK